MLAMQTRECPKLGGRKTDPTSCASDLTLCSRRSARCWRNSLESCLRANGEIGFFGEGVRIRNRGYWLKIGYMVGGDSSIVGFKRIEPWSRPLQES